MSVKKGGRGPGHTCRTPNRQSGGGGIPASAILAEDGTVLNTESGSPLVTET
jgi:hypothetical protein